MAARPRRRAHGQAALAAAKGTVEGSAADYGEGVESATRAALLVEKIRQVRPWTPARRRRSVILTPPCIFGVENH